MINTSLKQIQTGMRRKTEVGCPRCRVRLGYVHRRGMHTNTKKYKHKKIQIQKIQLQKQKLVVLGAE